MQTTENEFFNATDSFDPIFIKELLLQTNPTLELTHSESTPAEEVAYFIDPSKPLKREPEKMFQLSLFS